MKKLVYLIFLAIAGAWAFVWYVHGVNVFSRQEPGAGVPVFSISEKIPNGAGLEPGRAYWRLGAAMPTARVWPGAAELQGKIYVAGGMDGWGRTLDVVEVYDPQNDMWSTTPPLPKALHHVRLVSWDGLLYSIGGLTGLSGRPTSHFFIFDPKVAAWQKGPDLPIPLGAVGAAAVADGLHVFGGRSQFGSMSTHFHYDISSKQWSGQEEMATVRDSLSVETLDGKIWVMGGRAGSAAVELGNVEYWTLENGQWEDQGMMSTRRSDFVSGIAKGHLYVMGGESATSVFRDVMTFDGNSGKWLAVSEMPEPRHGAGYASYKDMIFVIGGGHRPGWSVSGLNQVFIP